MAETKTLIAMSAIGNVEAVKECFQREIDALVKRQALTLEHKGGEVEDSRFKLAGCRKEVEKLQDKVDW